jgi:hypothetical protein
MEDLVSYKTKRLSAIGIDPKELRIGNLVNHNGQIITVKNISEYGINKEDVVDKYHEAGSGAYRIIRYKDIQPILLTEKILKKSGFKNGEFELDNYSGAVLKFLPFCGILRLVDRTGFFLTHNGLKNVHDLQNIFYDLNGYEIEIKL